MFKTPSLRYSTRTMIQAIAISSQSPSSVQPNQPTTTLDFLHLVTFHRPFLLIYEQNRDGPELKWTKQTCITYSFTLIPGNCFRCPFPTTTQKSHFSNPLSIASSPVSSSEGTLQIILRGVSTYVRDSRGDSVSFVCRFFWFEREAANPKLMIRTEALDYYRECFVENRLGRGGPTKRQQNGIILQENTHQNNIHKIECASCWPSEFIR